MRRFVLAATLLAVFTCALSSAPPEARIVAIGDVHGASQQFVDILAKAGLADAQGRWTGGRTVFVQTGDISDRGAGMKAAFDMLMALERDAQKTGGKVVPLLGNHEVMNMLGEMRDGNPEIFATFGGEAAMRAEFGPKGRYGKWLRGRPVVARIDDTIFMHAGINPEFSDETLDDINRRARKEISQFDEGVRWLVEENLVAEAPSLGDAVTAARTQIEMLNREAAAGKVSAEAPRIAALLLPVANIGTSSLFHADGPLWFRGFNTWTDEEGAPRMAALLKKLGAKRFVTGHSVQSKGEIRQRFDGSLFLIDTGMLDGRFFPGGRASALEITADGVRPLYP